MSKPNSTHQEKTYAKRPDQPWRGEETRPGPGGSETPEAAATRAEGNAPVPVEQANVDEAVEEAQHERPSPRNPDDEPDSAENAEEKRQAAAEEHAAEPSHRWPHGKL